MYWNTFTTCVTPGTRLATSAPRLRLHRIVTRPIRYTEPFSHTTLKLFAEMFFSAISAVFTRVSRYESLVRDENRTAAGPIVNSLTMEVTLFKRAHDLLGALLRHVVRHFAGQQHAPVEHRHVDVRACPADSG
jgi:hypothetical protein